MYSVRHFSCYFICNYFVDEDCHFLTICTQSRDGKRPVLVWIHYGAYIAGCGEESAMEKAF